MTALYYECELYHHGIKGQKWGIRRYRNLDGTLTPAGKKRYAKQEYKRQTNEAYSRYEKSIKSIEKGYKRGQNLSKKDLERERQAEERYQTESTKAKATYKQAKKDIKDEAKAQQIAEKQEKWSDDAKTVAAIKAKSVNEMSNAELKKVNERMNLERNYSQLNPTKIETGAKYIAGAVSVTASVLALHNNSGKLINLGKTAVNTMLKR